MKGIFLFIVSAFIIQPSRCDLEPFWDLASAFSLQAQDDLTPLLVGNLSNYAIEFGPHGSLVSRQLECVDPGYVPCPNVYGCCPAGDDCFPNGCCPAGQRPCGNGHCYDPKTSKCCSDGSHCRLGYDCVEGGCCPSGQQPCGSQKCYNPKTSTCCQKGGRIWGCPSSHKCCSDNYCYDPDSEQCCENGPCLQEATCCEEECCRSIAYCAEDGYCSPCPATTKTIMRTIDSTYTSIATRTITEVCKPEEAGGFTCLPMTATNDEGATLELDTGCVLSYMPQETTTSDDSRAEFAARDAAVTPLPQLRPRQLSCIPYSEITETRTSGGTITYRSTTTTTVCTEPTDFSCIPMSVTNEAGDELSLGEDCRLEFSPAEPNSTTVAPSAAGNNAPQGSQESAASRGKVFSVPMWGVIVVAFLAL